MNKILMAVAGIAVLGGGYWYFTQNQTTDNNAGVDMNVDGNGEPILETASTTGTFVPGDSNLNTPLTYTDGLYQVMSTYQVPNGKEHDVFLELVLRNDAVSGVSVAFGGDQDEVSTKMQAGFTNAYAAEVVGKKLDELNLARVGGASLTTGAFNQALAMVKEEAAKR